MDNNANATIRAEPLITPETELDAEPHADPKPRTRRKSRILLVLIPLVIIATGVGLFFLLRPAETEPEAYAEKTPEQEAVEDYRSILGSSDASASEKFRACLDLAKFYLSDESYSKAVSVLNRVERDSLSLSELYKLYSAYVHIYDLIGDEANSSKYTELMSQLSETEAE